MLLSTLKKWKDIKTSHTLVNWLTQVVLLPFSPLPPPIELSNRKCFVDQDVLTDCQLGKLAKNGVIKKCKTKPLVVSALKVVQKKGKVSDRESLI